MQVFYSHDFKPTNIFLEVLYLDFFSSSVIFFLSVFYLIIGYFFYKQKNTVKFKISIFFILIFFFLVIFLLSFDLFLLVFVFESLSITTYFLIMFSRVKNNNSIEAVVKYFFIGAFSTFFLLVGVSLIFGHFGTTSFLFIKKLLILNCYNFSKMPLLLIVSVCFLVIGFFFKLGIFPFNFWVADVYEGMSFSILLFYNTIIKVSMFSIVIKLTHYLFVGIFPIFFILYVSCVGSLVYGCIAAIRQHNIKRFMAFTATNNFGWLLLGLCCGTVEGLAGTLIYLLVYTIINFLFFFIFLNIENYGRSLVFFSDVSDLNKIDSLYAISLIILIFSMAGFPPFSGFFVKYCLVFAAINSNLYSLVLISLVTSCVSGYYYLILFKFIFFESNFFSDFNFFYFCYNNIYIYIFLFILIYFLIILGLFLNQIFGFFLILAYNVLTPLF